jgi:uncharacterized membrane protein (UPF0127 family)
VTVHHRWLRWLLVAAFVVLGAGLVVAMGRRSRPEEPVVDPLSRFGSVALTVDPGDGSDSLAWCLLAAITADERSRGLMEITDLRGYAGMAFIYDEDVDHGFYMRNTPTPLSIAWISAAGQVVSSTDMAPCGDRDGCPVYPPAGRYRYAIEVPQGRLGDLGIGEAATVTVGGGCSPS